MNQHENIEYLGARNMRGMLIYSHSSHMPPRVLTRKVGGKQENGESLVLVAGLEERKSSYCEKSTKPYPLPLP